MTLRLSRFVAASSLLGLIALAGASVTDDSHSLIDDPAAVSEPVVQVWGARTLGIKGLFGVHTWIAVKPSGVPDYTVYEVIGWRLRWTDTALVARTRAPDRWFGSAGELYAEKRGAGVDELIKRIDKLAAEYPYAKQYTLWPGPNSNTFVAYITRAVPELKADLPATAIGKDYLGGRVFSQRAQRQRLPVLARRPARHVGQRRGGPGAQPPQPQFRRRPVRAQAAASRPHRHAAHRHRARARTAGQCRVD